MDNLSPFEVALGRKAKIIPSLELNPAIPIAGTFRDAYEILNKKLQYFRERLINFRNNRLAHQLETID